MPVVAVFDPGGRKGLNRGCRQWKTRSLIQGVGEGKKTTCVMRSNCAPVAPLSLRVGLSYKLPPWLAACGRAGGSCGAAS